MILYAYKASLYMTSLLLRFGPGLACSFFGVLFIFGPTLTVQGTEVS